MNKKNLLLTIAIFAIMVPTGLLKADCDIPDDVPCPYENSEHRHHHNHGTYTEKNAYYGDYNNEPLRHNRSGYTYVNQIGFAEDDAEYRDSYKPLRQNYEDYGSEMNYHYFPDYNVYNQPSYVDYLPTYYRTYPYYIGHKNGPFFGTSYGGF